MNKTDWFQGRHAPVTTETSKALRIWLKEEEWLAFDNVCREGEWSRSHAASLMLSDWLRTDRQDKNKGPLSAALRLQLRRAHEEVLR